jgi:hypothetical protein
MALQSMEEEAERIYKDERGLLLDDEAASTRDAMWVLSSLIWFELIWWTQVHDWAIPLPHIAQLYARFKSGLIQVAIISLQKLHIFWRKNFWIYIDVTFVLFFFPGAGYRYEQSEFIERELEQMTEQIKSIIQTLNANQVNALIQCFHS